MKGAAWQFDRKHQVHDHFISPRMIISHHARDRIGHIDGCMIISYHVHDHFTPRA